MRYFSIVLFLFLLPITSYLLPTKTYAFIYGCDAPLSICSLKSLPAGAHPGTTCADGNGNYVYGTTNSCAGGTPPCIPQCGFGAYCCDPKPGYFPPSSIPGCNSVKNGSCTSVNTALGVIATTPGGLVGSILSILLGVSGGVAVLLIIAAGYEMMTSQGNPEKVKGARERLTSAIVGLIFIIFSIALLQIIGVTILQIPGFK